MLASPTGERIPLADHHHQFWQWVWALKRGARPQPLVCIWPRGGGKSTSVELACVAIGAHRTRSYVLYVSGTQKKADDHVASIATLLESENVAAHYPALGRRSLNLYGTSRGWRRNRLRTEAGLTVDALGLDVDTRGVKLDEQRPDLIIFDDVDETGDSQETIRKKLVSITQKILPAGSSDAATLAVQNLVRHDGIFARLANVADEPADFLADRIISGPFAALTGAEFEKQPDGKWSIVAGQPIWAGQSVAICQQQVYTWGIRAFRSEAQHERTLPEGQAFPEWDATVHVCKPFAVPTDWPKWRSVDYGYSVPYTCGWFTRSPQGRIYMYRETYGTRKTAREQAYEVRALSAGEQYKFSVGDPAMWASQREGEKYQSVADQYGEMGVKLTQASNNRLTGKSVMHAALDHAEQSPPILQVFATCHNFIRTLPMLPVDPHKPEDVDSATEDHCLIPGTLITTPDGDVPISQIRVGDLVMTRQGAKRVARSWMTSPRASVLRVSLSNSRTLIGTGNHPVWVDGYGWKRLDSLRYGDILQAWEQSLIASSSMASCTDDIQRARTVRTELTTGRVEPTVSEDTTSYIGTSGDITMGRSQMTMTSTIEIRTHSTMLQRIWSAFRSAIISWSDIASRVVGSNAPAFTSHRSVHLQPYGIARRLAEHGIVSMQRNASGACPALSTFAKHADLDTRRSSENPIGFALTPVSQSGAATQGQTMLKERVLDADRRLGLDAIQEPSTAPVRVLGLCEDGTSPVYNLTIDGPPEFFANGILVHNSYDMGRYALMAAPWLDALKRRGPESYGMGNRR